MARRDPQHIYADGSYLALIPGQRGRFSKLSDPPLAIMRAAVPRSGIMVELPNRPAVFLCTHRCVNEVACTVCKVPKGHPCRSLDYHCGTHYRRRDAASDKRRNERLARGSIHA